MQESYQYLEVCRNFQDFMTYELLGLDTNRPIAVLKEKQ